jgi:hypothetical protein
VNEHERLVPADAQRPPQPAKRDPLSAVAVRLTLRPAKSNTTSHRESHELPNGGSVASWYVTNPLPGPVRTIRPMSSAAADEAPDATSISRTAERPAQPSFRRIIAA